jgi:3-oxoadipate enol-lactonase
VTDTPGSSRFIDINRARLYVETTGAGEPLVLVHNGIGDLRTWDDQVEPFAAHYRVIRYDMRGWGRSICPKGAFSHSRDLAAIMEALDTTPAIVIGSSFGGRIALDLALERPDTVRALVLVSSALGGYRMSEALDAFEAEIEAAMEAGDIPRAAEVDLRVWVDGPNRRPGQVNPEVRERARVMAEHVYEVIPQQSRDAVPMPPETPALQRLTEIAVPTLVIVGDQDQPDTLAIANLLVDKIPNARKVVMRDTAHLPHMEQPHAFNRIVLDFLRELEHKPGMDVQGAQ